MRRGRLKYVAAALLAVTLVAASGCSGEDKSTSSGSGGQLPRNQTLYVSGTQWGPPTTWNPINPSPTTGTVGLVYEPLFLFDPNKIELTPWLAESGTWGADNKEYTVKLRSGIKWGDGKDFTADDVKFTVELGKFKSVPYSNVWNWLKSVDVVDPQTVKFTFTDPRIQEFENFLYENAMVPKHLWEGKKEADITTWKNEKPVGTGPYELQSKSQDRTIYKKKKDWWAEDALKLSVKPKYIVDIVNSSNEVALGLLLQGKMDLSNNFLPGIANLVKGNFHIKTYYKQAPYMLSANTAMLIPNTTKAPLNDPAFRKAMAWSIDTKKIVEGVYGNIVKASNPTGLLPLWDKFVDQPTVDSLGFKFDTAKAKSLLAAAGYKDTNGDKWVESPKGAPISLKLIVPSGWTDWMEAARVITASMQAAGMNVQPEFPDAAALDDARTKGNFDLLVNNWTQMSNTPWTFYNYVYQQPVQASMFNANFERINDPAAWSLVQTLSRTKMDDPKFKTTLTDIEKTFLTTMPAIPMWYNGLWSQVNDTVWTNFPSEDPNAPKWLPTTWNNMWELSAIKWLTEIKPAKK